MKKIFFTLILISCLSGFSRAQDTTFGSPQKLTHEMSPEELLHKNEIGKNFVETNPPVGPVRNVEEFGRMQGALVRYPFGIPISLIKEMAANVVVTTIVASTSQKNTVINLYVGNGVDTSHCNFLIAPTDSYWTRDYGPWFESDSSNHLGIVDFPYNRPRPNDDEIPKWVAEMLGIPWFGMNLISTGGDYMTDGMGISASTTLIWTENPTLTHEQVAQKVHDYLGIGNYQVVPDPNVNTSIDHIDCWGKFLAPDKILIRKVNPSNACYNALESAASYWASQTCSYGYNYRVFRVQTPSDQPYSNSVILNNKVLVPFMNSNWDDSAKAAYEAAMPGYTVIGFLGQPSTPWISTDALHCRVMGIADIGLLYIRHIPLSATQPCDNNYIIDADIIACSDSAVKTDSVLVYYKVNNGAYQVNHMTNSSANHYTGIIPKQPAGSTIRYYLFAADQSNRRETAPIMGAADPFTFTTGYTNIVAVPDTLWFITVNDALGGKVTYLHNYMTTPVSLEYVQLQSGDWPMWFVDSISAGTFPNTVNPGDSVYIRVKVDIATDRIPDAFYPDTLNYTTSLGPKRVILMINPQILGGISEREEVILLRNNFPNPFSATTTLSFRLSGRGNVDLGIYDLNGRLIRNICSGLLVEGDHSFKWDGTDNAGNKTSAGIYLYRLITDNETLVKRMVLIR
ncbi:MAG: agmatine deiminase family protein [Bacteroidetes bacterium]|nr:agmatine deiminase family protein [Bacteroidota bacterium]